MSAVSESLTQLEVLVVDLRATAAALHGHLLEMGWARHDRASAIVRRLLNGNSKGEAVSTGHAAEHGPSAQTSSASQD